MPTPTSVSFTVSTDFPAGLINPGKFAEEIEADPNITTATSSIETDLDADSVTVTFKDVPSLAEETALWGKIENDVLAVQVDGTLDPGATPTIGDRYVLTDAGNIHANFGVVSGAEDGDICEWDGADFEVVRDVSVVSGEVRLRNLADGRIWLWNETVWAQDKAGGLIANHDHLAAPSGLEATIKAHDPLLTSPDGVPYAVPKASGIGFILHNRDILICMGKVTQATAVEDLKVNTGVYNSGDPYGAGSLGDGSQVDWGEAIFRGCYKRVTPADPNGAYTLCTNQVDADANASLTIVDFIKGGPGTPETFEVRGGSLFPDVGSTGFGANPLEHRIYAVMAPGTGSDARFFDAYLEPYRLSKSWVPATSSDALRVTATPPLDISSLIRVWLYSEPGYQGCHVLQFTLYRQ